MTHLNKIFISSYLGFVLYIILVMIWGPKGFINYNNLDNYRDSLILNISDLKIKENRFLNETRELNLNNDKIAITARDLGYIKNNENLIDVKGSSYQKTRVFYNAGSLVNGGADSFNNRELLLVFSSVFSLLVFIIIVSFGESREFNTAKRRKKYNFTVDRIFKERKSRYNSM